MNVAQRDPANCELKVSNFRRKQQYAVLLYEGKGCYAWKLKN